ncbi:MAG: protein kinase [Proteobacteria bacterium]|nr:protein kinase [Pseudomonadota bacterium]
MSNEKCRLCLKVNPPGSRFCKFCGNDLSFSIQADGLLPAGAILRGCYVIEDVIGEGGMGVVYRCHHNILGTRYALKVLNANLARVELLRQRFLAEAKIQATVRHPHIVHVLDVIDGQKDGGIPGVLAIVMEYIEGESLDQMLEQGPLSEHDAVSCALVILDAIGFAHHSGIVHRDLKPQNIMIRHTGAQEALYEGVKVMDFGIAKLLQQEDQRTATGQQMGTPRYMAPEQIENARNVDERTDLYAIGLTLYELLCGRTPFEEFKEFELMKAQLSMKPPSLRKFRAGISERLEAIVMKSLEKDRANRYPNAETFQRALLSLGGYDDIPLQLNPYEGTSLISTNQKLQDKIERTIARSGRSADKLKKVPSKLDNEKISRVQARITRESEAVNERDDLLEKKLAIELERARKNAGKVSAEQPSLVKEAPDSAAKKAKKENAKERIKSTGRQESKENTGAGKRRRSILNISKEKQSQPGSSSSHSFKRVRSSVRALLAGKTKASGNANDAENQAARKPDASTPQVKQEQALEAAKDKGTREAAKDKGTREAAKDKGAREAAKDKGALDNQKEKDVSLKDSEKKSARVGAVKRDAVAKAEPAEKQVAAPAKADLKRKSHSSVKIFIAIMLLLIAGGLIYRHTHQLPVQSAPEETAAVETVQADFAWKEVSSNAGRMTVVPAGLHWVSTGKKDELHQVKLSAFAIDQVEVSYYEYGKCIEAGKCAPLKRAVEDLNLPVTGIGFGSAEAFCKYAGKSLPSAEQWEAAARFGGETNGITHVNVACDTVNFGSGPRGECRGNTGAENVFYRVQGGNPGHILNMLGNVREWTTTADRKDRQKHQTKGGSYKSAREEISIGAALSVGINSGADDVGFRCIREM